MNSVISPRTTVGELLNAYPELEETLIGIAPQFGKLKNPVLRRTIAKVATLQHAALVAEIPVETIVNRLRKAAGQMKLEGIGSAHEASSSPAPDWFAEERIAHSFDARPVLEAGGNPLESVMRQIARLNEGDILELITPFVPAPMIEKLGIKGIRSWTFSPGSGVHKTYFVK